MTKRTTIKVCGTTSLEDALYAASLGVDALGFIFASQSPRYISPVAASEITSFLPPLVSAIGVFVDEEYESIVEVAQTAGLQGLQLHGNETPELCARLKMALPNCFLLKALRIGNHSRTTDFSAYNKYVSGFVCDTYVKGQPGGTGVQFDYALLKELDISLPILLAGGLNPDNIHLALETKPYGVDVNSGVEISPGKKNHAKLHELVEKITVFESLKAG